MKLTIHNVGHGMCISLTDGDRAILWDCGGKGDNRPSLFLPEMGIKYIDALVVTNYDEDHIRDLPNLLNSKIPIDVLIVNQSISWQHLYELKKKTGRGSIGNGMESLLGWLKSSPLVPVSSSVQGMCFPNYYNQYNQYLAGFDETNNISLVSFVNYDGLKFIIPGDLEKAGWEKLLEREDFRKELQDVNIFIASHHGRESGYCKEVFDYCKPKAVVICDSAIEYGTQEGMPEVYREHAKKGGGITFRGQRRFVLSTRSDGDID